jgi:hypothetical protein
LGVAAGFACTQNIAFGRTIPLHIGVTDWNLNLSAKPESCEEGG